jgi:hypothetical protein
MFTILPEEPIKVLNAKHIKARSYTYMDEGLARTTGYSEEDDSF